MVLATAYIYHLTNTLKHNNRHAHHHHYRYQQPQQQHHEQKEETDHPSLSESPSGYHNLSTCRLRTTSHIDRFSLRQKIEIDVGCYENVKTENKKTSFHGIRQNKELTSTKTNNFASGSTSNYITSQLGQDLNLGLDLNPSKFSSHSFVGFGDQCNYRSFAHLGTNTSTYTNKNSSSKTYSTKDIEIVDNSSNKSNYLRDGSTYLGSDINHVVPMMVDNNTSSKSLQKSNSNDTGQFIIDGGEIELQLNGMKKLNPELHHESAKQSGSRSKDYHSTTTTTGLEKLASRSAKNTSNLLTTHRIVNVGILHPVKVKIEVIVNIILLYIVDMYLYYHSKKNKYIF